MPEDGQHCSDLAATRGENRMDMLYNKFRATIICVAVIGLIFSATLA